MESAEEVLAYTFVCRVFLALSGANCNVSGLILRFLIHFELILIKVTGMDLVAVFCR
jgi:hypothetical protein